MAEGNVKWFNPRKGYGFITAEDGRDVFIHYASIKGEGYRTLVEGDPVTFDITEGEKGPRAENLLHKDAKDEPASAPAQEQDEPAPAQEEEDS